MSKLVVAEASCLALCSIPRKRCVLYFNLGIQDSSFQGLAYLRTDIGGAYKLQADDTWKPLLDWVDDSVWNTWGVDALATDPVTPSNLYLAVGTYTNSWDPSNGRILISKDYGVCPPPCISFHYSNIIRPPSLPLLSHSKWAGTCRDGGMISSHVR